MAIGGYFELELKFGNEYHPSALRLNSGTNAFEYILRTKRYKKIYLPSYTCDAILQPITRLGLAHQFYPINEILEPVFDVSGMRSDEALIYINYFGLKEDFIKSLARGTRNLIIDNAMGFFAKPVESVDTFYSPRKFFGVPDGAYLYTNTLLQEPLEKDISMKRVEHLLIRIEYEPEDGYPYFLTNEQKFDELPLKEMSILTQRLLKNIDYCDVSKRRCENFQMLDKALSPLNKLNLKYNGNQVPMVYPFYPEIEGLREKLIQRRIYVAQYWKDVYQRAEEKSIEFGLTKKLVPLPVDQRYSIIDMERIINLVREVVS
jgi:hypothetical protein